MKRRLVVLLILLGFLFTVAHTTQVHSEFCDPDDTSEDCKLP